MQRTLLTLTSSLLLAACASRPIQVASDTPAPPPQTQPVKQPFMFNEARLPKGFPSPGPVGEVIVKQYPAYRAARAKAAELGVNDQDDMFMPLFNHIQKNKIAMTAPVEMTYSSQSAAAENPQAGAMLFMYADPEMGSTGNDGLIEIIDVPAMTVLSVTVRGGYEDKFKDGIKMLNDHLAANPARYEVTGPPRFFGYSSPFVPWFLRIGETQIPIRVR